MSAPAVVTLIAAAVLVLALAISLVTIAYNLRKAIDDLGLVTFGVRAIAHRVEPIEGAAGEILENLTVVDRALADLLAESPMKEVV